VFGEKRMISASPGWSAVLYKGALAISVPSRPPRNRMAGVRMSYVLDLVFGENGHFSELTDQVERRPKADDVLEKKQA
jgi:hypothetical protein